MAPQATYGGPTALGHSKYASPNMRRAQLATFPTAVSSTKSPPVENAIATREQIEATKDEPAVDSAMHNSDVELAIAQGNALKKEVDDHAAKFSRAVSSAVANTRRLLELIRDAVHKEDPSALKSVEDLWAELESLFQAARGTNEAMPAFLEKQRNNMALYHASVMNETYQESQEELNVQHKKVNLQHGLILEHQQAFQDYKAQTADKLKNLEDLQDRVSRLTLEKGNFRQLLEQERTTRSEELKKADELHKQLDNLVTAKRNLLAEVESLQKIISDLQEKMQAAEQQLTDRFATELKEKADLLAKETAKATSLNALINTLKGQENNLKMEVTKVKAESKVINDKYNRMTTEHSQAFSKSNEQNKKIEALTSDADRLRKESDEMKGRLAKLPELEKANASLTKEKSDLSEQVGKLTTELKDNRTKANKELTSLTEKLHKTQLDNEVQKKYADSKVTQAVQTASGLEEENAKLKVLIGELKANQAAPAVGGAQAPVKEVAALEAKVRDLKDQNVKTQAALEEWSELAKRSYQEYKDMLPTYKEADKFRKAAVDAEGQIATLQQELATARASQSNGVGAGGDAAYWKAKYDVLLNSIDN